MSVFGCLFLHWCTREFPFDFSLVSEYVSARLVLVLTTPACATLARPVRICPITGLPAKYRDPRTNAPFANVGAYEMLTKVMGRGYVWCSALGCYVGVSGMSQRERRPEGEAEESAGVGAGAGTGVVEGVADEGKEDENVDDDEAEELAERIPKRRRVEVTDE